MLLVLHTGVAAVAKVPELSIDQAEAELLSKSTVAVLEQFDITPDPKTQALIGLVVAAGTVYAPRVVVYRMRRAQEKADAAAPSKAVVDIDMTGHLHS